MRHSILHWSVVTLVALAAILGRPCGGREIRPSDHGLAFQEASPSPSPDNDDEREEMRSFFGATASSVELPEAKDIGDAWRRKRGGSGGEAARGAARDGVRLGLLVASGVCGLIGVVLLVVSGVAFLFRLQKKKLKAAGVPCTPATGAVSS